MKEKYDCIIIGGGAAGLSAGAMAAEFGLDVLILNSGTFGGLLTSFYPNKIIKNVPGFPHGINASTCAKLFIDRASNSPNCILRNERVTKIDIETEEGIKRVISEENTYEASFLVLATGSRPNIIGIPGETRYNKNDRGVYYYAKNPEKFYGKRIIVAGGGETAIDAAHDLACEKAINKVILIHRRDEFRASSEYLKKLEEEEVKSKISLRMNTSISEIKGGDDKKKVKSVVLIDQLQNRTNEEDVDIVILAMGLVPNSEIYKDLDLELENGRYITINKYCESSIPGIYACGDITHVQALVVVASAQGSIAANEIYKKIRKYPSWKPVIKSKEKYVG